MRDALKRASDNHVTPWLIAPFVTQAALNAWSGTLRVTRLGFQILPAETYDKRITRDVVRLLRPVIGQIPFEYMGADRPVRGPRSKEWQGLVQESI